MSHNNSYRSDKEKQPRLAHFTIQERQWKEEGASLTSSAGSVARGLMTAASGT